MIEGQGLANQTLNQNVKLRERIAELQAKVERLELVIHRHNGHLDDLCDFSRDDGRCAAFVCRGRKCPDCPSTHKVDMEEVSGDTAGSE